MNVVSNVPTIQCLNSADTTTVLTTTTTPPTTQHVSNVNIVQTVQSVQTPVTSSTSRSGRTFTSTEAQTDDVPPRRRERKERRHRVPNVPNVEQRPPEHLPDILNSHLPPPYSTLPSAGGVVQGLRNVVPGLPGVQLGGQVPVVPNGPFTQSGQTLVQGAVVPGSAVPVSMVPVAAHPHPNTGGLRFLQFQNPVVGMRR